MNQTTSDPMPDNRPALPMAVLIMACLYPAAVTGITFSLALGYPVSYGVGKVIMVLIPALAWWRYRLSFSALWQRIGLTKTRGLAGLVSGLLFCAVIISAYYFLFKGRLDPAPIAEKVEELGILEWYWPVALFLSLVNSFMEEYYWRAFIQTELLEKCRRPAAVAITVGLLFGVHHVFPLVRYFPVPQALLFTFGTMVAGGAWAWMRNKGCSLWDCYLSHILADLAVFYVGWDLLQAGGYHG